MEDIPYRALLESLGWTQARAGAFLGVSRQTSNAFATGRRAAPAATLKLLRVVLYCSLTMSREHYNRLVQACGLPDIEAAGIAGANSQQAEASNPQCKRPNRLRARSDTQAK
jgi:transcriptional regulator with XRE-family HTH domain